MPKERIESNFCPYTDLKTQEYLGLLLCLNESYIQATRKKIEVLPLLATLSVPMAIVAVGSDGKQERHPRSRIELVLIGNEPSPELSLAASQLDLVSELIGLDNQRIGGTELKTLQETLSYYKGQEKSVYPDRVINSVLVYGNKQIHDQARANALKEISSPTLLGKNIRSKMKKQLHEYYKSSQTGVFRSVPAFSFVENKQFYHEGDDYLVTGFKIPFLRSIQRVVDLLTASAIENKDISIEELTRTLPTMTANRLEFLANLGLLDNEEELVQAYVWFLQQYHYIQEMNKSDPLHLSSLEFDTEKFIKHYHVFKNFMDRFLKKSTSK